MPTNKKKTTGKAEQGKSEKSINLRLPTEPGNDVYAMLAALAKAETRSLNSMIIELIKRASK